MSLIDVKSFESESKLLKSIIKHMLMYRFTSLSTFTCISKACLKWVQRIRFTWKTEKFPLCTHSFYFTALKCLISFWSNTSSIILSNGQLFECLKLYIENFRFYVRCPKAHWYLIWLMTLSKMNVLKARI